MQSELHKSTSEKVMTVIVDLFPNNVEDCFLTFCAWINITIAHNSFGWGGDGRVLPPN